VYSFAPRLAFDGGSLRALGVDDADALATLIDASRESLDRWLPHLTQLSDLGGYMGAKVEQCRMGTAVEWLVEVEGEPVGCVGLNDVQFANECADVGYWLAPTARGRGLATRAVSRAIEHAFDDLRMHRVSVRCIADNGASRALPERLGMVEEATIREAWHFRGAFVDHVIYRMLADEWRRRGS
jgi:ribosomal-protein-serine acetyltransferase